jgi:hypothetical protein
MQAIGLPRNHKFSNRAIFFQAISAPFRKGLKKLQKISLNGVDTSAKNQETSVQIRRRG